LLYEQTPDATGAEQTPHVHASDSSTFLHEVTPLPPSYAFLNNTAPRRRNRYEQQQQQVQFLIQK